MGYTSEQIESLRAEYVPLLDSLQGLAFDCIRHGQQIANADVQEHMIRGVGRRIEVIRSAIKNVFTDFPPDTNQKLPRDALSNVQINLQAFVINLYGVFDNFAWGFVLRHNLESEVGGKNYVGMFYRATQKFLPAPVTSYLIKPETKTWFEGYLKEYRDSLAHRIPLYVPPFIVTGDENLKRFSNLAIEKQSCLQEADWRRFEEINEEQESIGSPCYTFLHAVSGPTPSKPIYIHPQLIADGNGLLEFGSLFLKHWHERAI